MGTAKKVLKTKRDAQKYEKQTATLFRLGLSFGLPLLCFVSDFEGTARHAFSHVAGTCTPLLLRFFTKQIGWVRDASNSKCMEALSVQRFFRCLCNSKAFVLPWNSSALVSLVHFRQKMFLRFESWPCSWVCLGCSCGCFNVLFSSGLDLARACSRHCLLS